MGKRCLSVNQQPARKEGPRGFNISSSGRNDVEPNDRKISVLDASSTKLPLEKSPVKCEFPLTMKMAKELNLEKESRLWCVTGSK